MSASERNSEKNSEKTSLNLDQEMALVHLEGSDPIFLTGRAGSGKSFLIRHFLEKRKAAGVKIPVLASTGAAALLLGGRTFHSFFGLGIMQGGPQATLERASKDKRLKSRLLKTSELIIDEISMISSEAFDCAEAIARGVRGSDEPWGGMRIIAVGDFSQLPPVSKPKYGDFGSRGAKEWAFLGEAWATTGFRRIELKTPMRAEDPEFLNILDDLRKGEWSIRLEHFLKSQTRQQSPSEEDDRPIVHLFPRRESTDQFNEQRLSRLEGELRSFPTLYRGDDQYFDRLKRDSPIPEVLKLKKQALVMIRVNDPKGRFVNGSIGTVEGFGEGAITIRLQAPDSKKTRKEKLVDLETHRFVWYDADGNDVAFCENFPLTLAYASTIHKIQGATLERIHVDLGNLWDPGQAYVAVSRVRKRTDVTFSRWTRTSVRSDPFVAAFEGEAENTAFRPF